MDKLKIKLNISVNRVIQMLLIFLFISNAAGGLLEPLFAVFVVKSLLGATIKTVGFAIAISAVAKSVIQIPLARRIDKQRGERDDFYVMVVGAIAVILYPLGLLFVHTTWQLYLLSILNGAGNAFLMAAYYSLFSHHVDRNSLAFEWSLFSVGGLTLSTAVGSVVGGILADAVGFNGTFIFAAVFNLVAALLLVLLYPLLDDFKKKPSLEKIAMP